MQNQPQSPPLKSRPLSHFSVTDYYKTPSKSPFFPHNSSSITEKNPNSYSEFQPSNEKKLYADRFIPLRPDFSSKNLFSLFESESPAQNTDSDSSNKENSYAQLLQNELLSIQDLKLKLRIIEEEDSVVINKKISKDFIFSGSNKKKKVKTQLFTQRKVPHLLKFCSPQAQTHRSFLMQGSMNPAITPFMLNLEEKKPDDRDIPSKPYKTLDAPFLEDDFYLNLIDWSSKNLLSVILGNTIFLYNHETAAVTKFLSKSTPPYFSSSAFDPSGGYIALGNNDGKFELYDLNKPSNCLYAQKFHESRITTIAWNNTNLLATGSKDKSIKMLDLRISSPIIRAFYEHKQEVCGLKWSYDGLNLASGGNDNKVFIWSINKTTPELKFEGHTAAVKALTWSPNNRGVLLTGGGTSDTSIKVWNTLSNTIVREMVSGSQVCNILFSKTTNEFVSSHGFEKNEIIVWDYESFEKKKVLKGHNSRVLFLCMSKNGRFVASGAGTGDETVKIWDVFPELKEEKSEFLFPFNDLR